MVVCDSQNIGNLTINLSIRETVDRGGKGIPNPKKKGGEVYEIEKSDAVVRS